MPELTEADREALRLAPEGWFAYTQMHYTVSRPRYRCERLADAGALERRLKPEYEAMPLSQRLRLIASGGGLDFHEYRRADG